MCFQRVSGRCEGTAQERSHHLRAVRVKQTSSPDRNSTVIRKPVNPLISESLFSGVYGLQYRGGSDMRTTGVRDRKYR